MRTIKEVQDRLSMLEQISSGKILITLEGHDRSRVDAGIKVLKWVLGADV